MKGRIEERKRGEEGFTWFDGVLYGLGGFCRLGCCLMKVRKRSPRLGSSNRVAKNEIGFRRGVICDLYDQALVFWEVGDRVVFGR